MSISPEAFVTAWQSAASIDEVAEKLGISQASAMRRARRYRILGVRLKQFREHALRSLDINALNAIVDNGHPPRRPRP